MTTKIRTTWQDYNKSAENVQIALNALNSSQSLPARLNPQALTEEQAEATMEEIRKFIWQKQQEIIQLEDSASEYFQQVLRGGPSAYLEASRKH